MRESKTRSQNLELHQISVSHYLQNHGSCKVLVYRKNAVYSIGEKKFLHLRTYLYPLDQNC